MLTNLHAIKRWLQATALLHILIGLSLPFIVESPLFSVYRDHLHQAFMMEAATYGENTHHQTAFLVGLFGPTIASWGVLFLYVVNSAFARPTPQAWWFMLVACLVWAPYDSVLSLLNGVYLNAIINAVVFPIIVVPLLMVKKHFSPPIIKKPELH